MCNRSQSPEPATPAAGDQGRSSRRSTLPANERGRASTISTRVGHLYRASDRAQWARSPSGLGAVPGSGTTKATIASPVRGSGSPTTAASATSGCPVDQAELAVVVGHGDVAGAEPAVGGQRPGGGVGVAPVAEEDVGTADLDLARVARQHIATVGVDEAHVDTRERRPDRAGGGLAASDRRRRHDGRSLGEAVAVVHHYAEALAHPVEQVLVEGRRPRDGEPN